MDLNPYARFLAGRNPIPIIAASPEAFRHVLESIPPEHLDASPAPGKWSPRQIMVHLADCEIAFAFRIRQALAPGKPQPIIQPFDQNAWAANYVAYDSAIALSTFTALRAWNLKLVQSLSPLERSRPTMHPERGPMTLWTIVETMAGHDLNHLQQIEKIARPA